MQTFKNKNVILTGGTGGIGSQILTELLKNGAKVCVLAQDPQKLYGVIQDPQVRNSPNLNLIALDLKEPYLIEKKFRKAISFLNGQLDSLILSHGVIQEEGILNTNMLQWDTLMNINCRTHFHLVSIAMPFLKLSKGNVVVVSNANGISPAPGCIINSTAAAMLNMLVKCAALESSYFGVRVNGVAPGITQTDIRVKSDPENFSQSKNNTYLRESAQDIPLFGQINEAKDVAHAALFLASDDASFVTGEIMVVDGG